MNEGSVQMSDMNWNGRAVTTAVCDGGGVRRWLVAVEQVNKGVFKCWI